LNKAPTGTTAHKKQTIRMVLNYSILKRASALALLLQVSESDGLNAVGIAAGG
jgi:hypothetical protein